MKMEKEPTKPPNLTLDAAPDLPICHLKFRKNANAIGLGNSKGQIPIFTPLASPRSARRQVESDLFQRVRTEQAEWHIQEVPTKRAHE